MRHYWYEHWRTLKINIIVNNTCKVRSTIRCKFIIKFRLVLFVEVWFRIVVECTHILAVKTCKLLVKKNKWKGKKGNKIKRKKKKTERKRKVLLLIKRIKQNWNKKKDWIKMQQLFVMLQQTQCYNKHNVTTNTITLCYNTNEILRQQWNENSLHVLCCIKMLYRCVCSISLFSKSLNQ